MVDDHGPIAELLRETAGRVALDEDPVARRGVKRNRERAIRAGLRDGVMTRLRVDRDEVRERGTAPALPVMVVASAAVGGATSIFSMSGAVETASAAVAQNRAAETAAWIRRVTFVVSGCVQQI